MSHKNLVKLKFILVLIHKLRIYSQAERKDFPVCLDQKNFNIYTVYTGEKCNRLKLQIPKLSRSISAKKHLLVQIYIRIFDNIKM